MFKKKKKDKQRQQASENEKNLDKNDELPSKSRSISPQDDNTDGFDENGFVDLQPIASDATLLGPRQICKYVGTFAVASGTDGQRTLKTHKERTSFVKDHLHDYRDTSNGVKVVLQISSDGIKVFGHDAKRVRMAYPLPRISFATCDPDFFLFAFMTYSPTPEGVAVHGHVFAGRSSKQVQELTVMIGKAFKLAYASSRLQKHPGMNTEDIVPSPDKPAKKWAKHETHKGHDSSEHAEAAKDKKKAVKAQRSNSPSAKTDGSPVIERAAATKQGWRGTNSTASPMSTPPRQRKFNDVSMTQSHWEDVASDGMSSMSMSSNVSESSYSTETSETSSRVTETQVSKIVVSRTSSEKLLAEPYSPHRLNFQQIPDDTFSLPSIASAPPLPCEITPPLPPRKNRPVTQYLMNEEGSPLPPMDSTAVTASTEVAASSIHSEDLQSVRTTESEGVKVTYLGDVGDSVNQNGKTAETPDKPASHHDEYWYMPGIPREFIMEMLETSEEGAFFVRNSQSRTGCHALTVRVPKDFQPNGFGNYLIMPVPEGVKMEGFNKVFPDLMSLIEHYAQHPDGLPCKLLIGGSNLLCENCDDDDYTEFEPVDPDYRLLSDFHSMMDELKY